LSGAHLHPAVSIGFGVLGNMHAHDVFSYIAGQCVGAIVGTWVGVQLAAGLAQAVRHAANELPNARYLIQEQHWRNWLQRARSRWWSSFDSEQTPAHYETRLPLSLRRRLAFAPRLKRVTSCGTMFANRAVMAFRIVAALVLVASLAWPVGAYAQSDSGAPADALGNDHDVGSGAVHTPQTPQALLNAGTPITPPGPPTLVLGTPAPADGEAVLVGPVLHAEGNLVLIQVDGARAVIVLPEDAPPSGAIPVGALLEAWGPATGNDLFGASGASIWLPTNP
jgi:hypothetical protein